MPVTWFHGKQISMGFADTSRPNPIGKQISMGLGRLVSANSKNEMIEPSDFFLFRLQPTDKS